MQPTCIQVVYKCTLLTFFCFGIFFSFHFLSALHATLASRNVVFFLRFDSFRSFFIKFPSSCSFPIIKTSRQLNLWLLSGKRREYYKIAICEQARTGRSLKIRVSIKSQGAQRRKPTFTFGSLSGYVIMAFSQNQWEWWDFVVLTDHKSRLTNCLTRQKVEKTDSTLSDSLDLGQREVLRRPTPTYNHQ